MNAVLDGLKALGAARLIAMGVVAVGLLGLLGMLALRGGNDRMALLYSELDAREAGQIVEILDKQKIPHQLGRASGFVSLVPSFFVISTGVTLSMTCSLTTLPPKAVSK